MFRHETEAAQSDFIRRSWLVLLVSWVLPLLAESSGLDVWLENYYFSPVIHDFPWRDVFWFNVVAHDGMRTVMVFMAVTMLFLLVFALFAPAHIESLLPPFWCQPRVLAYLLIAVLAGPALVSVLKLATTRQCPWHLSMYGGDALYSAVWNASLFNLDAPGRCFPGSHASSGFALLGFVPLLSGRHRIFMIFFSLLLGLSMGWTRMMQGAHFLSHNLWSAWVCWAAVLLTHTCLQPTHGDFMQTKYASRIEAIRLPVSRVAAVVMMSLLLVAVPREMPERLIDILRALGLVLAGLGAFGRLWCSIYIGGRKTHELVMDGPYALCRNPLYLFSLVGALGVAMTAHSVTIFLLAGVFFSLYYPGVIRSEESKLQALHGLSFARYCASTPAFFPRRFGGLPELPRTVDVRLFRKHMAEAIWFILAVAVITTLDVLHALHVLPSLFTLY